MKTSTKLALSVLALLLLDLLGETRRAAADAASDKAASVALFNEGRRLAAAGKYLEACPKFEASMALAPGLGTQLNLADCYQQLGRTASAWTTFRDAAVAAGKAGDSREQFARDRMAQLEPRLAHLTITLSVGADVAGLELRRDGQPVARAIVDVAVPIDPGVHLVAASATNRRPWSEKVTIVEKQDARVVVPVLVPDPAGGLGKEMSRTQEKPMGFDYAEPPRDESRNLRLLAYIGVGVGATGFAVGTVFGLMAKSTFEGAKDDGHCNETLHCDPMGITMVNDALGKANISTAAFVVGAAAMTGGIILYFLTPKGAQERGTAVNFGPTPDGAAVSVSGRF